VISSILLASTNLVSPLTVTTGIYTDGVLSLSLTATTPAPTDSPTPTELLTTTIGRLAEGGATPSIDSIDPLYTTLTTEDGPTMIALAPNLTPLPPASLPPLLVLPGSFNPLHCGHVSMLAAAHRFDLVPCFELALTNADKGSLPLASLKTRLETLSTSPLLANLGHYIILLTNAPLFSTKAELISTRVAGQGIDGAKVKFIVGHDTYLRIVDPKYYGGSKEILRQAIDKFAALGVGFEVVGRDGKSEIEEEWKEIFEPLQGTWDISSSAIREGKMNPDGTPTLFVNLVL